MNATRATVRQSFAPLRRSIHGAAGRYVQATPPAMQLTPRSPIALKNHLFFEKATAEGAGRNGPVESFGDAPLKLNMSMPKATGGKGSGQNPEQLFAMGYASCFLGALQLKAAQAGKADAADIAKVSTKVFLGHPSDASIEGMGLRVELIVENFDDDAVIAAAHEFCPYSRALTRGVDVTVTKA